MNRAAGRGLARVAAGAACLVLAACGSAPRKAEAPAPTVRIEHHGTAATSQPRNRRSPYAPAQEDPSKRGNYTRGGLYAPGVADSAPTGGIADVDEIPEPEVTDEPHSRYGNRSPYTVLGKTYRVLDALYSLAFGYPKRAPFFAGELAQLFALGQDEHIDVASLTGSYAGAMGLGQFMPSSYRLWGKDGDGDGKRDLISDKDDVFASIANYFVVHGWQRGGPVVARVALDPSMAEFIPGALDPVYPLPALAQRGYHPLAGEPVPGANQSAGATVIGLDGGNGREYWFGYRNFYVITRYNHSPMYAMAVHQLAQAIRAGSGGA
jgi:lytic murein transglycosylase B